MAPLTAVTERPLGGVPFVLLSRSVGSVTSAKELETDGAINTTLAVDDYRVVDAYLLERLQTGTNPRAYLVRDRWRWSIPRSMTPRRGQRDLVDLVKLALAYEGVESHRFGRVLLDDRGLREPARCHPVPPEWPPAWGCRGDEHVADGHDPGTDRGHRAHLAVARRRGAAVSGLADVKARVIPVLHEAVGGTDASRLLEDTIEVQLDGSHPEVLTEMRVLDGAATYDIRKVAVPGPWTHPPVTILDTVRGVHLMATITAVTSSYTGRTSKSKLKATVVGAARNSPAPCSASTKPSGCRSRAVEGSGDGHG